MQQHLYKLVLADIINPVNDQLASYYKDGAMLLKRSKSKSSSGFYVDRVGKRLDLIKLVKDSECEILDFRGKLVVPTFVDTHFHWVQDDVCLMPKDNLLQWLKKYTWPAESKFKNKEYTKLKSKFFAKKLLSVGTTAGAVYCSIHQHTVLASAKEFVGDFIFGNVLMTMNSPDYLLQTESDAIASVRELSSKLKKRYALTPRFAPTTSPSVMKMSGKMAKRNGSFIQTHLSETTNEIEYVLSIYSSFAKFKKVLTYTEIYDRCGLVTDRTIFGHGIHLSDKELKLLSKKGASIAHCPTSNGPIDEFGLGSGLFDFEKCNANKVAWALASDIGGGPFLSMIDVMNSFVYQNKRAKVKSATYVMALNRATNAGAKILKIKRTGNFKRLNWANFVVIDDIFSGRGSDSGEKRLEAAFKTNSGIKARKKTENVILKTFYKGNCLFGRDNG